MTCIRSLRTRWTFNFTSENLQCMIDSEYQSETKTFPDKFVKREILSLRVNCMWYDRGCSWEGELREFEMHCLSCGFNQVVCPNTDCGMVMNKSKLSNHTKNECQFRFVNCQLCDDKVAANIMDSHQIKDCPGYHIRCQHCGKAGIPRGKMQVHVDALEGDCEVVELCCPFVIAGCSHAKREKRAQLRKHLTECMENHLNLMVMVLKDFAHRVDALSVNKRPCPVDNNVLHAVEYLCADISRTSARTDALETQLAEVRKSLQKVEKKSEVFLTCLESGSSPMLELPTAMGPEHLFNLNDLQHQNQQMANCVRLLWENLYQLKPFVWTVMMDIESNVKENRNMLMYLSSNYENLDSRVGMSYTGHLVWKITNVGTWLLSAENKPLQSPVFCTGRFGYKMSVELKQRLCQSGLKQCVSLVFVIMKGDYDQILHWPFQQKITMKVMDQDKGTSQHLSHIIIPNDSAPFKRPQSNKNVPAESFASLWPISTLQDHPGYIVEDTMFIEIIIDTSNLM